MPRAVFLCLLAVHLQSPALCADKKADLPLVFHDDFAKGAERWQPTDAKAWKVVKTDKGSYYSQFQMSKYTPKVRSPLNISLVKDLVVGDFVLTAKVQSTGKDGPHRDMCLFFGYQDPSHFYYVHIAKKADDHANQIFIVNGEPRKKISTRSTDGTPWDDKWHDVKIVRKVGDGSIAIYFDDMKTPIMTATDKTFTWGQVGVGSFDDSGNWMDVRVEGVKVKRQPTSWYPPEIIGAALARLSKGKVDAPMAIVGLGDGSLACYGRPSQHVVFIEIDKRAAQENEALRDAKNRGSRMDIVPGDSRLVLNNMKESDAYFRFILVDLSSTDAIPVHQFTKEAMELYLQKLAPDGIIGFQVTNRYVELYSVIIVCGCDLKLKWRYARMKDPRSKTIVEYVFLARDERLLPPNANGKGPVEWSTPPPAMDLKIWTDDFADLRKVLRDKK
jgi:hypothetical protein